MPTPSPLPDATVTRSEAAQILGVTETRVSRFLQAGTLQRATGRKDGRSWRHEVEALAAARAARREAHQLEAERRRAEPPPRPLPAPPADQEATFEELMLAAEWTRESPGPFVDTEGAAAILGCTPQYVGRLAARGRLPWLPTGRSGGQPTRVYRRTQIEVIARARASGRLKVLRP